MGRLRETIETGLRGGLYAFEARNPLTVIARRFGLPVRIRLLNGFAIPGTGVARSTAVDLVRLSYMGADISTVAVSNPVTWVVSLDRGEIITPGGIRFDLTSMEPAIFAETFLYGVHDVGTDLAGKVVVDAGAFVGDTSLLYASLGASVLAFEPDPTNYRLLLGNLERNPEIAGRVRTFNAAVGNHGYLTLGAGLRGGSGAFVKSSKTVQVPCMNLEEILNQCPDRTAFLLKADCKGTEFDLVDQPALSKFERLSIEYSADLRGKDVSDLARRIEGFGFEITQVVKHNPFHYSLRAHGTIRAVRRRDRN